MAIPKELLDKQAELRGQLADLERTIAIFRGDKPVKGVVKGKPGKQGGVKKPVTDEARRKMSVGAKKMWVRRRAAAKKGSK